MKNSINKSWVVLGLMALAATAHAEAGGDHGSANGGDGLQMENVRGREEGKVLQVSQSINAYQVGYVCNERSQVLLDVVVRLQQWPNAIDLDRLGSYALMVCATKKTELIPDSPFSCDRPTSLGQWCWQSRSASLRRRAEPVSDWLTMKCAPSLAEVEREVLAGKGCVRFVERDYLRHPQQQQESTQRSRAIPGEQQQQENTRTWREFQQYLQADMYPDLRFNF